MAPHVTARTLPCGRRSRDPHPRAGRPGPAWLASLSEREVEVFRCLARGLSNGEIADELFIAPATVKTHVASLLAKVAVRDRVQLVVVAYTSGFASGFASG